jgi:hypothetical protein
MIESTNPAEASSSESGQGKKEYDRYFQTENDSKGLNRRLLSERELSYPENLSHTPYPVGAGKSVR